MRTHLHTHMGGRSLSPYYHGEGAPTTQLLQYSCVQGLGEWAFVLRATVTLHICVINLDKPAYHEHLYKSHVVIHQILNVLFTSMRDCMLPTCSYDGILRVWDTRSLAGPVAEHAMGGGVWRIKPHPQDPTLLLVAAMYNAFQLLRWDTQHCYGEVLFHRLCHT